MRSASHELVDHTEGFLYSKPRRRLGGDQGRGAAGGNPGFRGLPISAVRGPKPKQMRQAVAIRRTEAGHRNHRARHRRDQRRPFVLAAAVADVQNLCEARVAAEVIDVPVRMLGNPLVMRDPGAEPAWTERRADIDVAAGTKVYNAEAADAYAGGRRGSKQEGVRAGNCGDRPVVLCWHRQRAASDGTVKPAPPLPLPS